MEKEKRVKPVRMQALTQPCDDWTTSSGIVTTCSHPCSAHSWGESVASWDGDEPCSSWPEAIPIALGKEPIPSCSTAPGATSGQGTIHTQPMVLICQTGGTEKHRPRQPLTGSSKGRYTSPCVPRKPGWQLLISLMLRVPPATLNHPWLWQVLLEEEH